MFKIKSDNLEIYDLRDKKYLVESPKVTQELNKSGELTFYLPPKHPNYDKLEGLINKIQLYNNDVLEFTGRIIENKDSFYNKRYLKIEGALSYLCDSIQPLNVYKCTPIEFFRKIIEIHNSQVEEEKQFNVGMFTISDSNNYIYRYTNYENTLEVLQDKIIDTLGGYLRVRYMNGNKYIDIIEDYGKTNSQVIQFGKNLLDLDKYIKFSSICTAMLPLGNELEETVSTGDDSGTIKKRLTIDDYADGTYGDIVKKGSIIYSKSGVEKYGFIYADKSDSQWNDVTHAENLYTKAVQKLNSLLTSSLTIELSAVDLNLINVDIEKIELGDKIRVLSKPHNLDEYFVVSKIVRDLANPKNTKITLGNTLSNLSSSINRKSSSDTTIINELKGSTESALKDAKEKATDAIKSVQGGYVKLIDGELYILDNEDINQAQKIWRWNLNGLGYTQDGKDGEYGLAMTMDGQIVADYITTGTLRSIQIINGEGFSVDASGNVKISSSESEAYKYTSMDVTMALRHIKGEITLPDTLIDLFDVNDDGNLQVTDVVKMINIMNGTADPSKNIKYTVSINPNDINNTIVLNLGDDDSLRTIIGINQIYTYMMKTTQLLVGEGYSTDISNAAYGIRLDGQNKQITITDTDSQVTTTIDSGQVNAYNVYASSGGGKGHCMHGKDTTHTYRCHWTGTTLQFWVDTTNVGNLSDKRLKTDIEDIDDNFLNIFEELSLKQFKLKNRNGKISFGIIAQDLLEIAEKYNIDFKDYELISEELYENDDETLYYMINYEQLLILYQKYFKNKITKLEQTISEMKGEN